MRAQGGGSSAQTLHAFKKRKHTPDVQLLGRRAGDSSVRLEVREVVADPPRHGVGKGLITSQGHVVPLPLPLLVKDREYAVDITCFIVRDANLNECLEHETDPLGDSGFHELMRVSLFTCPLPVELSFYFDHPLNFIVPLI